MLRKTMRNLAIVVGFMGALLLGSAPAMAAPAATPDSASIVDVTSANYDDVIQMSYDHPVVLDFTATWCHWCQMEKPYLQQYNDDDNGSWVWARVDVDQNPDLSDQYGVNGIPDLIEIKDGQEVGSRFQGWDGPQPLRDWLDQL